MIASNADSYVYAELRALTALRHQTHGFSFLPRQPVRSVLSGRYAACLRGRGLNFEELRHYRPGDDIRALDWKVTRRTGKPHVRVYTEERDRPVLLLIDQRITMFFGSRVKMKSVAAAELAALAAWRVIDVGDRVGGVLFNDGELVAIKPQRSRHTVMQILRTTVRLNHALQAGAETPPHGGQLNQALMEAERLCGHDTLVLIVSDMNGWDAETVKCIKRLARHNDVIVALIFDPLEQALPAINQFVVSDGRLQLALDSRQGKLRRAFSEHFSSGIDALSDTLRRHGVPVIPVDTVEPVPEQLRRVIGGTPTGRHGR